MAAAAYAQIASDLRGGITSRDIKPGGHLPSELDLRDKYHASRNTVLDAIKMLKDEGLVETRSGLVRHRPDRAVRELRRMGRQNGDSGGAGPRQVTKGRAANREPAGRSA